MGTVEQDLAKHLRDEAKVDAFDAFLSEGPVWEGLSRKDQAMFGWTAMQIAQNEMYDECEAGRRLVKLLREYGLISARNYEAERQLARSDRG